MEHTSYLLQRTFVLCDAAMAKAELKPGDLDAVILAGGSTLLPLIRDGVAQYFGREPLTAFDPTTVVAIGASVADERASS